MLYDDRKHHALQPSSRPTVSLSVPLLFALAMWILALLPDRPWTFYGRFERIRLGMSKAQVRSVMGRVGNDARPWAEFPTYLEKWKKGETEPSFYEAPPWKVYWADTGDERWSSRKASIIVNYDAGGRVQSKLWLEERPQWPAWCDWLRKPGWFWAVARSRDAFRLHRIVNAHSSWEWSDYGKPDSEPFGAGRQTRFNTRCVGQKMTAGSSTSIKPRYASGGISVWGCSSLRPCT